MDVVAVDMPLRHAHHHHDLFICFNSRFSFNLSSTKPLRTSPAHPDRLVRSDNTPLSSVSSSSFAATRHLRNNNNAKPSGQASPMFPSSSQHKRGCHFETAEPSSPTVTCIGQVRVKKKKKKKKDKSPPQNNNHNNLRSRSGVNRGGEFSFRMMDGEEDPPPPSHISGRTQKWVHLPFASCFFCPQRRKEKAHVTAASGGHLPRRRRRRRRRGSCAAALSRWVLALHPDQKKEQEEDASIEEHFHEEEEEEEQVCEPPRNALLLMRCRSDPSRISALSTHFLDSTPPTLAEKEQRSALSEEGGDFRAEEEGVFSEEEEIEEGGEYDDERVVAAYFGTMMSECDSRAADSAEEFPISEGGCSEPNEDDDGMSAMAVVEEGRGGSRGVGEKKKEGEEKREAVLPDCFLMMMRRETKVSTEVSKETWVCGSDFLQRLPRRRINPVVGEEDGRLRKQLLLPPRSSCCLPGVSMAAMIEQRLAAAAAFEPVVLTRCKSEPVRAAQEVCRWRKGAAVVGIGAAAGV